MVDFTKIIEPQMTPGTQSKPFVTLFCNFLLKKQEIFNAKERRGAKKKLVFLRVLRSFALKKYAWVAGIARFRSLASFAVLLLLQIPYVSLADIKDPYDPFDSLSTQGDQFEDDENKTPEELIAEARYLLQDERPLDARTKLLKALQKDPKEYTAHILLAAYYMGEVGHFRLALKYVKRAMELFQEKNGKPPYQDFIVQMEHARLLYLLAQARLNLDDYNGALQVLDEFKDNAYFDEGYPGSRAWVLMKLGRVQEAVKVARAGILAGAEPGRTLNMLGILLSMTGERQTSLEVFKQAIRVEMSLGKLGQPATPLNNSGEVYKEIFDEPRAQSSWLTATSLPDGCEHVLPSLNLALIYLDELNFIGAKRAIDDFESCVAQFPLRNGEEHRALVRLARGRIALHTGDISSALTQFREALNHQQWFGKIGTNVEDLKVGVLISLAQALKQENNQLKFRRAVSWSEWLNNLKTKANNWFSSWWYFRRARQVLLEDLNSGEDIYIRNTDSLLEYPTLGETLKTIPNNILKEKLLQEETDDGRREAKVYYDLYLAENYLGSRRFKLGNELLNKVLLSTRAKYDDLLRSHALLLKLQLINPDNSDYRSVSQEIYSLSRAALRNYGFRLPVNFGGENEALRHELEKSAFILDNSERLNFAVYFDMKEGSYVLEFASSGETWRNIKVEDKNLREAVNKFTDEVFRDKFK